MEVGLVAGRGSIFSNLTEVGLRSFLMLRLVQLCQPHPVWTSMTKTRTRCDWNIFDIIVGLSHDPNASVLFLLGILHCTLRDQGNDSRSNRVRGSL